jgi:hypothetical protein
MSGLAEIASPTTGPVPVTRLKTPAGKKYVETQPVSMNKIMQSMDSWNRDLSVTVVDRVRAEMKKKGHDL